MSPELLQRLKSVDAAGGWEEPVGFDFSSAASELKSHWPVVELILGVRLEIDGSCQDCSHLTDLYHGHIVQRQNNERALVTLIALRFSRFDRMVTIWGTELKSYADRIPGLIGYLEAHGYRYVSHDDLAEPYSGEDLLGPGATWWDRFFDYM